MIKEGPFVELVEACARACLVLKNATERRDTDNSSGPSEKQIKDLGRCVDIVQRSPLTVSTIIRILRHVESVVAERANCRRDLQEYHPRSTEEHLIAWRMEMCEILRVFDVRDFSSQYPQFPNYLRWTRGWAVPERLVKLNGLFSGPLMRNCQHPATFWCVVVSPPLHHPLLIYHST